VILLAGLGNPGERYEGTRHNIGFMAVERVVARAGGGVWRERFAGRAAEIRLAGDTVVVLQPWTFMNDSGRSVRAALGFYRLAPADLLVVHDELDLPFGELRLKLGGGEAGHRGLRSITSELQSGDYGRLRLGIGRPPAEFRGSVTDFVLQAIPLAAGDELSRVLDRAAEAVELVAFRGFSLAMNEIHRRPRPT
jgi:peptidyl-tRNA hydrolase, PTH1 family